jgi:hypothetical protein
MTYVKDKLSLDATKLKIIAIVLMVFDHVRQEVTYSVNLLV